MTNVADKLWKTFLAIVAILEILSCTSVGSAGQLQVQVPVHGTTGTTNTFLFGRLDNASVGAAHHQCTTSTKQDDASTRSHKRNSQHLQKVTPILWAAKPTVPPDNVCNASDVPPHSSSPWYSTLSRIVYNILQRFSFGLLLAYLWMLECIRRAKQARALALDRAALVRLEQTIATLDTAATPSSNDITTTKDKLRVPQDSTPIDADIKSLFSAVPCWIVPTLTTLVLGFSLLPSWTTMWQGFNYPQVVVVAVTDASIADYGDGDGSSCFPDTSLAHACITQVAALVDQYLQSFLERFHTVLWQWLLPFHVWQEPILFFQRLRLLARWLRHIRFAGPILRMLLKVTDQLWVLAKTWYQSETVESERAKRLASRSLLQRDLERIEQQHKWQTTLASMSPSLLQHACRVSDASSEVTEFMTQQQESSVAWKDRLDGLKRGVQYGSGIFSSVDIYDGVVELEGDPANTNHYVGPLTYRGSRGQGALPWQEQDGQSFWNRYLISPQTRFSVAWRLIVTVALLSELGRLYVSWHLVGTFQLSYPDLTDRLWGRRPRTVAIQEPNGWKTIMGDMVGKILRQNQSAATMYPGLLSANSSMFLLQGLHIIAFWGEVAIDIVGFLDILVWFFTGELDKHGFVVPKPFFTRCILPGTLIQVLDHPTVPSFLPNLIGSAWNFASKVGYGRSLRWLVVLYGATSLWIIQPLCQFLFQPLRQEEYMKYTHSWVGIFPILSEGTFGTASAAILDGGMLHKDVGPSSWGTFDGHHGTSMDLQEDDKTSSSGTSPSEGLRLDDELQTDDPNCF